jgi:hypothetical protein
MTSDFSAHERYANEKHLTDTIKATDAGYFAEYKAAIGAKTPNDIPVKAKLYLDKGIALSRSVCFDYLDSMALHENNASFAKEELGVLVILATGIMGLNGASQDSFSRLALGGSAVNSSIDIYRNHYLLGPDGDAIVTMVKQAMNTAQAEIENRSPTSFVDAYALLESYSRLCSDTSIRRLVRESIKSANFKATSPINNEVARIVIDKIAEEFDRSGLSDEQMFGLYWFTKESPTKTEYLTIIDKSLGDIQGTAVAMNLSTKVKIKNLFLRVKSLASSYQELINKAKLNITNTDDNAGNPAGMAQALKTNSFVFIDKSFATTFNTGAKAKAAAIKLITNTTLRNIPSTTSVISPEGGVHISVD